MSGEPLDYPKVESVDIDMELAQRMPVTSDERPIPVRQSVSMRDWGDVLPRRRSHDRMVGAVLILAGLVIAGLCGVLLWEVWTL